jgi:hypothetical protein
MQKFLFCTLCRRFKTFNIDELKDHLASAHQREFKLYFLSLMKRLRENDLSLIYLNERRYIDVTSLFKDWMDSILINTEVF